MSDTEIVHIDELDLVYLSYDEPQKEEFWVRLKAIAPWAKRVDGIKGSDTAHKAAAAASTTERFILVDGDNLVQPEFFDQYLEITPENRYCQFRWRARNHINGLHYGNGGISSWTKSYVNSMRTHENSAGSDKTNIEFCFDSNYWPLHNCYSTSYANYSPKQAWRAGFREGVKLCSRNGKMPENTRGFKDWVFKRNYQNLSIWHTIGRDVENGFWSLLGARLGTHYLMLREWDYVEVQDFDCLDRLWELHKNDDEQTASVIARELNSELDTNIVELNSEASKFFKDYIASQWQNKTIMTREGQ
jgi:hypothetical protein